MTQGEGASDERRVNKMARQARRYKGARHGRRPGPREAPDRVGTGRSRRGRRRPLPKKEKGRRARYIVPLQERNPAAAPTPTNDLVGLLRDISSTAPGGKGPDSVGVAEKESGEA
jgi:hypothetical protein